MHYDFGRFPSIQSQREWVDAIINDRVKELNGWEEGFIADMDQKLKDGVKLNDNQVHTIETIYARVTE